MFCLSMEKCWSCCLTPSLFHDPVKVQKLVFLLSLPNSWGCYWTLWPQRFVFWQPVLWHCWLTPRLSLLGHMAKYVFVMPHDKLACRLSSSPVAVVLAVTYSAWSFTCDRCMSWIGKHILLCTQHMNNVLWKSRPFISVSYTPLWVPTVSKVLLPNL